MRGAAVEALVVTLAQDGSVAALSDGEIDRACGSRDEPDGGGLVAFADDAKRAVAALHAEVLDGRACFADSQPVQAEQHGQGGVGAVVVLGGEQEHAELGPVEASSLGGMDLWPSDVLGWVGAHATVDVSEPVEAAHRRQPTINRCRRAAGGCTIRLSRWRCG